MGKICGGGKRSVVRVGARESISVAVARRRPSECRVLLRGHVRSCLDERGSHLSSLARHLIASSGSGIVASVRMASKYAWRRAGVPALM